MCYIEMAIRIRFHCKETVFLFTVTTSSKAKPWVVLVFRVIPHRHLSYGSLWWQDEPPFWVPVSPGKLQLASDQWKWPWSTLERLCQKTDWTSCQ